MAIISLSRMIAHWAALQGDKAALDHHGASVTWREFEASTNRLARAYERLGVRQDDFVTIALPNGAAFFEACFAAWKLGATPQPVSSRLPKLERDQIIELAQPTLIAGCAQGEYGDIPCLPETYRPDPDLPDTPLPERTAVSSYFHPHYYTQV